MIDFDLALFTRCELYDSGSMAAKEGRAQLDNIDKSLLQLHIGGLLGTPFRIQRLSTFLQRPVTFLDEKAEFRIHTWVELPKGHPRFPNADRGLVSIVRPISPVGFHGGVHGEVAWLGEPLPANAPKPDPSDWIALMEYEQGYRDLPDSWWKNSMRASTTNQLFCRLLHRHLQGMVGRRVLERQLGIELAPLGE